MNVGQIYEQSYRYLQDRNIPTPDVDAKAIISHHLGLERNELFLHKDQTVGFLKKAAIERDIRRRGRFEPVAYILGYKYFFHDKFLVSRGTLIPRADTEHLLYAVQNTGRVFKNIIDIGTGSGAIAVSLSRLFPSAEITALDINISAARRNIRQLGVKNVRLMKRNFLRASWPHDMKFDLIVSNPPYLSKEDMQMLGEDAKRFEPRKAFFGGKDGMVFYERIAGFSAGHLQKDGYAVVETDHKWKTVREIFWKRNFRRIEVLQDYNGLERVLVIQR